MMIEEHEGSRTEFMEMLAEQDSPPAFILRAQRVAAVWEELLKRCERDRAELLEMPRMRLATIAALVQQEWLLLRGHIPDEQDVAYLHEIHDRWKPKMRVEIQPTSSPGKLQVAIGDLRRSFERFNRRWKDYVQQVNLVGVNYERQQYNDYYVVEKAAALGSERLAQTGFERLDDLTSDDVLAALPFLRVP